MSASTTAGPVVSIEATPISDYLAYREAVTGIATGAMDSVYIERLADGIRLTEDSRLYEGYSSTYRAAVGLLVGAALYAGDDELLSSLNTDEDELSNNLQIAEREIVGGWFDAREPRPARLRVQVGEDSLMSLLSTAVRTDRKTRKHAAHYLGIMLHNNARITLRTLRNQPGQAYSAFEPDQYRSLVGENVSETDPILAQQEADEWRLLTAISDLLERQVIDLGAGEGRITRPLAGRVREIIAIENNPAMFGALRQDFADSSNVRLIEGDITDLETTLQGIVIDRPVQLLLQNTLGTIDGDQQAVLDGMVKIFKEHGGDVVMTLFRAESLMDWGLKLYPALEPMLGRMNHLDLGKGGHFTAVGKYNKAYVSKWRNRREIEQIIHQFGGRGVIKNQVDTDEYVVLHFKR